MTVHPIHPDAFPLSIGFLSPHNALDRRAFSGSVYFAARALENDPGLNVRILGEARAPRRFDQFLRPKPYKPAIETMDLSGLDAVVGMVATPLLNDLAQHTDIPLLHVTDATPAFLRGAYGWPVPEEADLLETRVAARAVTVYSSDVMAARAPGDLGLPGLAPAVLPFGVNFDHLPTTCPAKPPLTRLNLLFVGLDWTRKGGDIAVAALDLLRANGHDAHLTIVGRCPERHRNHLAITYAGFLDKNRPRDAAKLAQFYEEAHLLLLPSRGDCTPIVIAEAMAHGTPVLASDVGGTLSQIGGEGTGRVLPLYSPPALWADTVVEMTQCQDHYAMLSDACFDRATKQFSWAAWARGIKRIVGRLKYEPLSPARDQKVAVGH